MSEIEELRERVRELEGEWDEWKQAWQDACDGWQKQCEFETEKTKSAETKLATCEKYRDAYAECDRIGTQAVRDLEAKVEAMRGALERIGEGRFGTTSHARDIAIAALELAEAGGVKATEETPMTAYLRRLDRALQLPPVAVADRANTAPRDDLRLTLDTPAPVDELVKVAVAEAMKNAAHRVAELLAPKRPENTDYNTGVAASYDAILALVDDMETRND